MWLIENWRGYVILQNQHCGQVFYKLGTPFREIAMDTKIMLKNQQNESK